ncbi:MAG TPA: DUF1573 domain-containing protein [bacterium]|nr:DUF1573 domain-containing protein [bacterium]
MQNSNSQQEVKKTFKESMNTWKAFSLILTVFLAGSLVVNAILIEKNYLSASLIEAVSTKEIYPMFECPCCGKAINECTCPMAKERMMFIDTLAQVDIPEEEIIMAYVKKYGLNSFTDKHKQEEFRGELIEQAPANRSIISLNSDFYDFENVSQKKGKVYAYFEIKNEGKSNLIIDRIETSCGCTFASIIFKGKESPLFTMPGHGDSNSVDWEVSIPFGETAQLKVLYDPNVHKDFRGPAVRTISIFSNDPVDFEKSVRIELNQID